MTNHRTTDSIGELFRQKLADHRIPVDDNGWDKIERCLHKPKNRTVVWLWRGSAVAAAVVAILLLLHQPTINPISPIGEDALSAQTDTQTPLAQIPPQIPDAPTTLNTPHVQIYPTNKPETDTIIAIETITSIAQNHQEPPTEEYTPPTPKLGKETPKTNFVWAEDTPERVTVIKRAKKWTLAAAVGMGQGKLDDLGNHTDYPVFIAKHGDNQYAAALSNNVPSFRNMPKNDFTDIRHLPQFSMGLMARKSLWKRVEIESGIIYTYLESRFTWPGYHARQSLHYIGIPVHAVANLWTSQPHWSIYFSAGFTVEKGVRAIYSQEQRTETKIHNTIVKSSIDGFQWSLNSAIGVNYRLSHRLGIYFEPQFGYSFNSHPPQPISIRTEWPLYIGFGAGINYHL